MKQIWSTFVASKKEVDELISKNKEFVSKNHSIWDLKIEKSDEDYFTVPTVSIEDITSDISGTTLLEYLNKESDYLATDLARANLGEDEESYLSCMNIAHYFKELYFKLWKLENPINFNQNEE